MNDPPPPPETTATMDVSALRRRAAEQVNSGRLSTAIATYRMALEAAPDHPAVLADLGRLALRMGEAKTAEALFARVYEIGAGKPEAANDLAQALRDQERYDDAAEVVREVLSGAPDDPILWNTLGTILNAEGDSEAALTCFDESIRLAPRFATARYNRSGVLMDQGFAEPALADCDAALAIAQAGRGGPEGGAVEGEEAMMRLARAMMLLALGHLQEGWAAYEARLDPALPDSPDFDIGAPRLRLDAPLGGLQLLAVGEQGIGDEVLFASLVPDLIRALGPDGRLVLSAEPRLVSLFARSFPEAEVIAHASVRQEGRTRRWIPRSDADLASGSGARSEAQWAVWTPIASLLGRLRPDIARFACTSGFLRPDPARVAFWRSTLEQTGPGPKVGLTWRSGLMTSKRRRSYAALPLWGEVLTTPGVQWVQLQYGEGEAELAAAEAAFGLAVWRPPQIDLKRDLDDLAALTCALDLVVGAPNATTSLAAACGARTWFVSAPGGWIQLGADHHPWYPNARLFVAPRFTSRPKNEADESGWAAALTAVAAALRSDLGRA